MSSSSRSMSGGSSGVSGEKGACACIIGRWRTNSQSETTICCVDRLPESEPSPSPEHSCATALRSSSRSGSGNAAWLGLGVGLGLG